MAVLASQIIWLQPTSFFPCRKASLHLYRKCLRITVVIISFGVGFLTAYIQTFLYKINSILFYAAKLWWSVWLSPVLLSTCCLCTTSFHTERCFCLLLTKSCGKLSQPHHTKETSTWKVFKNVFPVFVLFFQSLFCILSSALIII